MRSLLAGFVALIVVALPASAQTILKRAPHYLAPGSVVFVDTGQCGVGKVMKVTGIANGPLRRKTCVPLSPQQATLEAVSAL
jgi:hypothetical protein